ncbi:MFS general substrate transporter [Trametes coccinea BRFM310]|uniref:MFS general substrate transporter n=1 Tax=Trametes coccinea (strain BRFM310) TaxID=1353009 RepID=A0A1Y2I9N0_TRAC3|nr:MFS general substrate transporter [Trametes coccinea BRFM310]
MSSAHHQVQALQESDDCLPQTKVESPSTSDYDHDHEACQDAASKAGTVWTKLDLIVLPVVTTIYFLSSLDRSNIGNARIAGLQRQLHMSDDQYSIALTATLITYTVIDIPSNLAIKTVGPRLMIPTAAILWGMTCTLQGLVHNYAGLIVCRLFLGLFEGGLLPAISLYLSSFYPRRRLQFRIAIMFSATSLASAFSGLLAAAILNMEGVGGKPGWAWLFILEGLFTVLFGASCYFMLPDTPSQIPGLSSKERNLVVLALREDGIINRSEDDTSYTLRNCIRTFSQPHVLLVMITGFLNGTSSGSLTDVFLPSIVAGLGYSGTRAQLMSVPPFAVAAVLSVITAFLADRFGQRGLNIIFFAMISLTGLAIFYGKSPSHVDHIRYGSLFLLVPGTYCIGPPLGTWAANNSAPLIRRATALALLPVMTNLGSILSTWLLGAISPAPRYTSATITLLAFQVGIIACAVLNMLWLAKENRRKQYERDNIVPVDGQAEHDITGKGDDCIWFEYVM